MGKASRWFRGLLGASKKDKKKNAKSSRNIDIDDTSANPFPPESLELDANKHAIAVAAATAAVAEAALAAAQAAAEVVRLTSSTANRTAAPSYNVSDRRRQWAAVKIQSDFRAYLARRALKALKGLVKLQAIVRGRIVRKQSADMLRRMQAMARIQARACAYRSLVSDPSHFGIKASKIHCQGMSSHNKYDLQQHSSSNSHGTTLKRGYSKSNKNENMSRGRMDPGSKWLDCWMEEYARNNYADSKVNIGCDDDDEKSDKILEIDTWKPRVNPKGSERSSQSSHYFSTWNDNGQGFRALSSMSRHSSNMKKPNPCPSSEVSSSQSVKDQDGKWIGDHSPGFHSASSKPGSSSRGQRGPFTPNRSECSRSMFSDFPNYMANTESSLAKVRSHSAPRQRMQLKCANGVWDTDTISEKSWSLRGSFRGKAYAGSGRIEKLAMPTHLSSSYDGR